MGLSFQTSGQTEVDLDSRTMVGGNMCTGTALQFPIAVLASRRLDSTSFGSETDLDLQDVVESELEPESYDMDRWLGADIGYSGQMSLEDHRFVWRLQVERQFAGRQL